MNNHIDILASFEGQLEKIASDRNPGPLEESTMSEQDRTRQAAQRLGTQGGRMAVEAIRGARSVAEGGDTILHRGAQKILGKNKKMLRSKVPFIGKHLEESKAKKEGGKSGAALAGAAADLDTLVASYRKNRSN